MRLVRMIDNLVSDREFVITYQKGKIDIVNYDQIMDFSSYVVSVKRDGKIYKIEGSNLVITKMMEEEILIEGNIENIGFNKLG